eukprot:3401905-Prymnesium_polylepis.1
MLGYHHQAALPVLHPRKEGLRELFVQPTLDQIWRCGGEEALKLAASPGRVVLVRHDDWQVARHCGANLVRETRAVIAHKGVKVEVQRKACWTVYPAAGVNWEL